MDRRMDSSDEKITSGEPRPLPHCRGGLDGNGAALEGGCGQFTMRKVPFISYRGGGLLGFIGPRVSPGEKVHILPERPVEMKAPCK